MTTRMSDTVVRFRHPFSLKGVDRVLPPGEYRVATEEDSIDGLSFLAYRRASTSIFLPLRTDQSGPVSIDPSSSGEMMTIDPEDLQRALARDSVQPLTPPSN